MIPITAAFRAAFALALLSGRASNAQDCAAGRTPPHHEQARLQTDLMCAYNSEYRPVLDHKTTVTVEVGFIVKYISFDSLEETFTLHSWVSLTWNDEFLKWDPNNYSGLNMTLIESQQIWTPRMALFNADASKYQSDSFYTTCKVWYNGTVTCVPHLAHFGICRTALTRWPYDTQNCTLYFGSWIHTGEQINFTFDSAQSINIDQYQDGPGWRLMQVAKKRYPGKYQCCPNDTYPMLKYTFVMEREAAGPAAIVVVPSVAIVMLTLVSFMLDIKHNSRLILACFSLFCHFIFLTEIGHDIPKESSETPVILLFIRDSMLVALAAVLLTMALQGLRARSAPAPGWLAALVRLAGSGPAKYIVFTEFGPEKTAEEKTDLSNDAPDSNGIDEPKRESEWLQLTNILNSWMLVVSFVTYGVLIMCYIPHDY